MKAKLIDQTNKIFQDPKLKGKHVILIAGKIFTARTGKEAVKTFNKVTKQYPNQQPTVTYIPKEDSLILVLCR
jgi:hypothetical protein